MPHDPHPLPDLERELFEPDGPIYYEKDFSHEIRRWEQCIATLSEVAHADPQRLRDRSLLNFHYDRIWDVDIHSKRVPDGWSISSYEDFLPRLEEYVETVMGRIVVRSSYIDGFMDIHLYVPFLYLENQRSADLFRDLAQAAELLAVHPHKEGLFVQLSFPHRRYIDHK